jgi:FkbM family methyltransferase
VKIELLVVRLRKIAVSMASPICWPAIVRGVAPTIEHFGMLRSLDVDGILDVGANRGQFALACRMIKPGTPIVSFEPIPSEVATFRRIHDRDPNVRLFECALGDADGVAVLHLSGRKDSSSLLPIGELQKQMFPQTLEVGTRNAEVKALNSIPCTWQNYSKALLKLDVQGYELNVLRGGTRALSHFAYIYAECSEKPLYDGQALRPEVEAFLESYGFEVIGRFNPAYMDGHLIQADYLFGRKPSASS